MTSRESSAFTVCLRSNDATERDGSVFTWDIRSENRTQHISKCFLASVELPMSQYSIESCNNRVYVCERLRITPKRRTIIIDVAVQAPGAGGMTATENSNATSRVECVLPIHLNPIVSAELLHGDKPGVRLQTQFPHALAQHVFDWVGSNEESVRIIGTELGEINLSAEWLNGMVSFPDEQTVVLLGGGNMLTGRLLNVGGHVVVPSPPTPRTMARLVQASLPRSTQIVFGFDPVECRYTVRVSGGSADTRRIHVTGGLARALGFADVPQSFTPSSTAIISSHAAAGFSHRDLRPGCYFPSQRIYNTTSPLRLHSEWHLQFARFHFPANNASDTPSSGLVWSDPVGRTHFLELVGRFTPESLVAFMTAGMNQTVSTTFSYKFYVTFTNGRFSFSCRSDAGTGAGTGHVFELLFDHARSIEAERIGFVDGMRYDGHDTYMSSDVIGGVDGTFGPLTNTYHITEIPGQRTLQIRPSAPAAMLCVAGEYDAQRRLLQIRCVDADMRALAHGIRSGALVTLDAAEGVAGEAGKAHESIPSYVHLTALVVDGADGGAATLLSVSVAPSNWAENAARNHHLLRVSVKTEPSSFCFSPSAPKTIGTKLGFPARTIQWGVDGMVPTRTGLMAHPFQSTTAYNLEQPDFVLLRLVDESASHATTTITYETQGRVLHILGKVVLSPLFRNERYLPVESGIVVRSGKLAIQVLNPDLSPHVIRGEWSLSLTFS